MAIVSSNQTKGAFIFGVWLVLNPPSDQYFPTHTPKRALTASIWSVTALTILYLDNCPQGSLFLVAPEMRSWKFPLLTPFYQSNKLTKRSSQRGSQESACIE